MTYGSTICIVSVTYGNRANFVEQVVSRINDLDCESLVTAIVLIDNASAPTSRQLLDRLGMRDPRLKIVRNKENLGSAAGYCAGLKEAMETGGEFIWLLDDDNAPARNSLVELLYHYRHLAQETELDRLALLSLREDRDYLAQVAKGTDPRRVFARESSFLGFHLADIPRKVLKMMSRPNGSLKSADIDATPRPIPYGPYGGLFFHRAVIEQIGYPNADFFLYGDDFEYTNRLRKAGGRLCLVPSSRIIDIDKSWHIRTSGSSFEKLLNEPSDARVYYTIRNQIYLETQLDSKIPLLYTLNKVVFELVLSTFARSARQKDRLKLIRLAIQDGMMGRLGKKANFSL